MTVAGTVAAAVMLELSVTTVPPVGAGPFRVTVAVEVALPATAVGERLIPVSAGAVTVNVFDIGFPLKLAVMLTEVLETTGLVVIVKLI